MNIYVVTRTQGSCDYQTLEFAPVVAFTSQHAADDYAKSATANAKAQAEANVAPPYDDPDYFFVTEVPLKDL